MVVQLTTLTSITHNWKGELTLSSIWNLTVTVKFSKLMLSAVIISTFNRTVSFQLVKLYRELNYCIRRADKRSMCLGDIFISHGIREGLPSSSG